MSSKGLMSGGLGSMGPQANIIDDALSPAPQNSLWFGAPQGAIISDMVVGVEFVDDFIGIVTGAQNWISTQATSGTANAGTLAGGTVALNSGAATQHQGIQIQKAGGHFAPAATKHMWYECRFQVNNLKGEFLWGLFDIDTTLISGGSLHATDGIGFKSVTSDGVILPVQGSSSTFTTGTTIGTLTTATWYRLGFTVTSNTSVQFYFNGAAVGSAVTTNIPSVILAPSFVCQAGASAGGNVQMDVDYINCIQLR